MTGRRAPWPARVIATFGYSGFFPWAPATLASLIVAGVYVVLPPLSLWVQAAALVVVTFVGVITSTMVERELGLDAHPIVIDEVAGMMVTYLLIAVPAATGPKLLVLAAGLALFRVFDILKPWPIDRIQHLPGGRGIMADDLLAGVYSNIVLRLFMAFGPAAWFGRG